MEKLFQLTPIFDKIARYQISHLYRQDIAVVSGGFLAGDRQTLASFYQHYHWKIIRLLTYERIVDDDQVPSNVCSVYSKVFSDNSGASN